MLGIRPSDLHLDAHATEEESFEVNVVISEYIGAQSVLIGECAGQKLVVELNSDTPFGIGEKTRFRIDTKAMHFFNKATDDAIVAT